MPRRKIVAGPEEIEYRLLTIVRRMDKASGVQALAALIAVAGLASLYKVDLGENFRSLLGRVSLGASAAKTPQSLPYDPGSPAPTGANEPLTVQPPDGIFDGLGDNNEQN